MPQYQVVLLGDSILDNRPYTAPAPDTTDCLRRLLGGEWSVEFACTRRRGDEGRASSTRAGLQAACDGRSQHRRQ